MSTASQSCSKCGSMVPPGASDGLCPTCLLELAGIKAGDDEHTQPVAEGTISRRFGDYEQIRPLGAGGMGYVYEALQLSLNRKVAIKFIRESQRASPILLRRFALEAEAVARLKHPNIVQVHEVGEVDGQPFFSMDLVEGESLSDKIRRGEFAVESAEAEAQRQTWHGKEQVIVLLMRKLALAVAHAHHKGVLHRDLKPANVLVDQHGEPYLTDFGLAKILYSETDGPSLTRLDEVFGTPGYLAPEQANGNRTTEGTDIYGLGAVMYALLTGRPPFRGKTDVDTCRMVVDEPPTQLRKRNQWVHKDLEIVCLKCLEKDPAQRYASAELLVEDLDNWLAGRPIKVVRPGLTQRTFKWIKRNPVGAGLIASLCFGMTLSLCLVAYIYKRQQIEIDNRFAILSRYFARTSNLTNEVMDIDPQELGALRNQSLPKVQSSEILFGVATQDFLSEAQRMAIPMGLLEEEIENQPGMAVGLTLRLFKPRMNAMAMLAQGQVDFILMSMPDYLDALQEAPGIQILAMAQEPEEGVIFVRGNSPIRRLEDLKDASMAFPDESYSVTHLAKARLAEAGVFARHLRSMTNFVDQLLWVTNQVLDKKTDAWTNQVEQYELISLREVFLRVENRPQGPRYDAGLGRRHQFEKHRMLLREIAAIRDVPMLYCTRPGLPGSHVKALRQALLAKWEAKPVDEARLTDYRRQMLKAAQFEGQTPPN